MKSNKQLNEQAQSAECAMHFYFFCVFFKFPIFFSLFFELINLKSAHTLFSSAPLNALMHWNMYGTVIFIKLINCKQNTQCKCIQKENKTVVNINSMECTENFVAVMCNAHTLKLLTPSPINLNWKFRFVKSQMSIRNVCTRAYNGLLCVRWWWGTNFVVREGERERRGKPKPFTHILCVTVFVS